MIKWHDWLGMTGGICEAIASGEVERTWVTKNIETSLVNADELFQVVLDDLAADDFLSSEEAKKIDGKNIDIIRNFLRSVVDFEREHDAAGISLENSEPALQLSSWKNVKDCALQVLNLPKVQEAMAIQAREMETYNSVRVSKPVDKA